MSGDALFDEALGLPLGKRAELAAALLRSLDGETDEDVQAAWAQEIQKRMQSLRAGTAELDEGPAVRERARDRLRNRRPIDSPRAMIPR